MLILGAFALAVGAGVRVATAPVPAVAVSSVPKSADNLRQESGGFGDGRPRWRELWTRSAPGVIAVALAPNGTSVAWVDKRGSVRRIVGETGKTLWQTPALKGINRLVVAPQGQVLAFSQMNPAAPSVRVLHPQWGANRALSLPVEGAIWRVALSGAGDKVLVGTGKSYLYQFSLAPDAVTKTPKRISIQGIPLSLCAGASEAVALFGTWQDNAVGVWGLDGLPRWRYDEREVDRTFEVQLSADGGTAVGVSTRGGKKLEARLHVWDARTGRLLWIEDLGAFDPKVLISRDGSNIAVSCAKMSSYNTGATVERKLTMFSREGRRLFADKGGLFFAPELVALSAGGGRITVRDGSGSLWSLDRDGRTVSRMRLARDQRTGEAPVIKEAISSDDGEFLLLQRGDDQISLYKAAS